MGQKLKIQQVKSVIGKLTNQKRTIKALGLKKIGSSRIHDDTPVIRGMINTVKHLVQVEKVSGE